MNTKSTLDGSLLLSDAPAALHSWIADDGSLTEKLVEASAGDFAVHVLQESWQVIQDIEERNLLGMSIGQTAWVREVALCCFGVPWVYARSVLPDSTLVGQESELKNLKEKPLGAVLFSHPDMSRGPIHLSKLSAEIVTRCLGSELQNGLIEPVWGRASLFFLSGKPLLVSEYFLPSCVAGSPS
ncbi:MAG: chorismate lyase [Pseudomonadales bacterium]|nr:chorismate lyase [Pseudomonadales bacterium]